MSHLGTPRVEEPLPPAPSERSETLWCFPASLLAACTLSSQAQQSAASSAQQSTAASAASHALHWIFISLFLPLPLSPAIDLFYLPPPVQQPSSPPPERSPTRKREQRSGCEGKSIKARSLARQIWRCHVSIGCERNGIIICSSC